MLDAKTFLMFDYFSRVKSPKMRKIKFLRNVSVNPKTNFSEIQQLMAR